MKTIKHIILIVLIASFTFSCKNKAPQIETVDVETEAITVTEVDPTANYAKAEFTIEGMTCAMGCAAQIQKKISKMDGVKSATVDFDKKLAMVEYDEAKVTPITIEETVTSVSDTYTVVDMDVVENFSTKKACCAGKSKKDCKATSKKDCPKNGEKIACEPGCEKDCCVTGIKDGEKMVCKPNCKEACCVKKAS